MISNLVSNEQFLAILCKSYKFNTKQNMRTVQIHQKHFFSTISVWLLVEYVLPCLNTSCQLHAHNSTEVWIHSSHQQWTQAWEMNSHLHCMGDNNSDNVFNIYKQ